MRFIQKEEIYLQITDEQINELIQKEIKEQVEKKMKQVGRETILSIYKNSVDEVVTKFLETQRKETLHVLNSYIEVEKEHWKFEVLNEIKKQFSDKIDGMFVDTTDRYY